MIDVTIKVDGLDKTIAALTKVVKGLGNHREFLREEVAPELKRDFNRVFTSRGFGTWSPLKRSTIRQKAKQGYPSTTLIRTRRYQRSAARLSGLRISRDKLEIRSPITYAVYSEYGTKDQVARPVFAAVAKRIEPRLPRLYQIYSRKRLLRGLS